MRRKERTLYLSTGPCIHQKLLLHRFGALRSERSAKQFSCLTSRMQNYMQIALGVCRVKTSCKVKVKVK
jgi:hypothetical protein